jgi:hypothetical protein
VDTYTDDLLMQEQTLGSTGAVITSTGCSENIWSGSSAFDRHLAPKTL